jgi:peptide chain release factor 1
MITLRSKISKLNSYSKLYKELEELLQSIKSSQEMVQDPSEDKELKKMAEEELVGLQEQLSDLQHDIEEEIIPKRDVDSKNISLEIR